MRRTERAGREASTRKGAPQGALSGWDGENLEVELQRELGLAGRSG